MASKSNHQGSSKKAQKNEDWISRLPDPILVHILSYLPTKYSFRTSILSSRWKYLWASVPILDFDFGRCRSYSVDSSSNLMNFVERVLFHHDLSCIQKFSLHCDAYTDIERSRINTWISVAIRRGVQELDININTAYSDEVWFPLSLFTCPTLLVLKLRFQLSFSVPCSVYFKSLKVLHVSVFSPGNDLTQYLFRNCPALEDLSLVGELSGDDQLVFDVSVPSLKRFKYYIFSETCDGDGDKIVVIAPILEYLTLKDGDYYSPCYVLKNLTSLVKADVNVGAECYIELLTSKQHADNVLVLLREICSVKHLSLGTRTTGALGYAADINLPLFPNLIRLELHVNTCCHWKRPLELVNCMPNLLYLVLEKSETCERCFVDKASKEFKFVEQEVVPCMEVHHLKEIEINGFWGRIDELKLIEFFLRKFKVLHKMEINTSNLEEKQERLFLEELLMLPRASKACRILLSRKKNSHHTW